VESDPSARDVVHDIVLADGEVVEILGANASVQEGPLTTFFHFAGSSGRPPTLRAVPADGDERAFG
jgi:hypothetical protein